MGEIDTVFKEVNFEFAGEADDSNPDREMVLYEFVEAVVRVGREYGVNVDVLAVVERAFNDVAFELKAASIAHEVPPV